MLGVIATDMIVAGGRSLYRPLEEAERQRGLGHRGVGEGETTEGQGPSVFGTEGRAEQSEVMKEPLAAGENEFKDAAVDTVPSGPMARVAAIKSEVKTEPNVKSQMGEYGYGTSHDNFGADDEEEVEITPQRVVHAATTAVAGTDDSESLARITIADEPCFDGGCGHGIFIVWKRWNGSE
ncbi:hypothetical protein PC129_g19679 [Phytophthora cactorum]|uniref:Uncharacterized protein n=1 Tax=Phytophthora cactorum TaxID=29920 RepID=A0A8T1BDM6_9STRA|nr:hypothetical protein PC117_g21736 [Phytophthora cactorum]KAG3209303.1 hypothetical protein PC129_g19679 [Phytophthora cactorum]